MGVGVGRNIVLGAKAESVYGTPVTVDRFYEVVSESLDRRNNVIQSNGMRGGSNNFMRRGSRRVLSTHDGGGGITMEVPTTTFGLWLNHLLGGTSTIAQQASTAAYLQTHTQGDLTDKSLTLQKQIRDASNTEVESFTFHGCKILAGAFSVAPNQILQSEFTVDAEDVDVSTAAASPSYSNVGLFHWQQGAITVGGAAVANVTNASWTITNPLKTDRYYLGGSGLKAQPTDNDFRAVTGSFDVEFSDPAIVYNRFAADTAVALVLTFTGGVIEGAHNYTLEFSIPEIHFTGDTPKVGGPDVVMLGAGFEAAYDGSNPGITVTYKSTDTAI